MKQRLLHQYYRILIALAHHYLSRYQPKVIGINGSVGKTSCRMIIYQTLQHFFPHKKISTSPKNFNGELGLSLSVFEISHREPTFHCLFTTFWICFFRSFFGKKRYEILLLEYGIDRPGEMDFILKVAHPDIGVFTAIDAVHSEQFGSPTEIANEEIKMALHTKELVFLNQDDPYAMQLFPRIQIDKLTYQTKGYGKEANISFTDCDFLIGEKKHEIQSTFSLHLKEKSYQVTTNLIGKSNYGYIGVALGIVEVLAYQEKKNNKQKDPFLPTPLHLTYTLQPGRLSIFAGQYESILFDSTYNASPQSVRTIIDSVITIRSKLFPKSEIWLILGDMRELGALTETEHRLLAGYVSQTADKIFLLGPSMQTYLADELEKVGFDTKKLSLAKDLNTLNTIIEKELKKAEPAFQKQFSFPLLVFKGSQNTIFLEESVKHFLLHPTDEKYLTRQSTFRKKKKKS